MTQVELNMDISILKSNQKNIHAGAKGGIVEESKKGYTGDA